jgi:hypothetical protein
MCSLRLPDLDEIEILPEVTSMYTGDISRAMGRRVGGWQQEQTTIRFETWGSPRPWWRLGDSWPLFGMIMTES